MTTYVPGMYYLYVREVNGARTLNIFSELKVAHEQAKKDVARNPALVELKYAINYSTLVMVSSYYRPKAFWGGYK